VRYLHYFKQKALETLLLVRTFVVGAGVRFWCCMYIHQPRKRRLGFITTHTTGNISATAHIRGIHIIFPTTSIGEVVVWLFVWFVIVFSFGAVHTSTEKEALGIHQETGIIRAAHAWYLHYFLNKRHWRRSCFFNSFFILAAFGFGFVHNTLAENEALGFHQEAGIVRAAQHMLDIYIIFSTN